jgi:hypothetical protein
MEIAKSEWERVGASGSEWERVGASGKRKRAKAAIRLALARALTSRRQLRERRA